MLSGMGSASADVFRMVRLCISNCICGYKRARDVSNKTDIGELVVDV